MAPLIAPGIARYTLNAHFGSHNIANVLDYFIDTTGTVADRGDAVAAQAGIIIDAWCDRILPTIADEYVFDSVTWVDLDELDGSTGIATTGDDEVLPQTGALTGAGTDVTAPNVAMLVKKIAPGGGRSTRNGRMYVAGVTEGATSAAGDTILAASVTIFQAAFSNFLTDTDGTHPVGADIYDASLRVVHTRKVSDGPPPVYEFVSSSDVTQLQVQALLATQRRRLRR
jgi:hypothetical protein